MKSQSILQELIKNNEFPILFIGSGISRRYLEKFPSWLELLEELWNEYSNGDFYLFLKKLEDDLSGDDFDKSFESNIKVASELEKIINKKFVNQEITVDNLNSKKAYLNKISPFKQILVNKFSKYKVKSAMSFELDSLKNMLLKSQVIFTTNYDTFLEDIFNKNTNENIKKYIGQKGFFQKTTEYAEIYKLHGCVKDVNSLIMTEEDYKIFDKNSVLITAKIISMLLNSPIIFLGYSITDRNIRRIIKDFSASLDEKEKQIFKRKIVVIEYKENEQELIEETRIDEDLGCEMTTIKTDNFKEIYDEISKINQGVSPLEISRYQHVIKELIVSRGKEGTLDTFLVSPDKIDELEKIVSRENIVLAIGDKAKVFVLPTIIEYCFNYINEEFTADTDFMLRFIAKEPQNSLFPMCKYVTKENLENSSLTEREIKKLQKRLSNQLNLEEQLKKTGTKKIYNNLETILNDKTIKKEKINNIIAFNIKRINLEKVKKFILKELSKSKEEKTLKIETSLKRLCLIYDLYKNKK